MDHWASQHSERVEAFAGWGSNVVDHLSADGSKNVAVSVDVHDMDAMKGSMESADIKAAKQALCKINLVVKLLLARLIWILVWFIHPVFFVINARLPAMKQQTVAAQGVTRPQSYCGNLYLLQ